MSVHQHNETPAGSATGAAKPRCSSSSTRSRARYGNRFLLEPAPDDRLPDARDARRSTRCG